MNIHYQNLIVWCNFFLGIFTQFIIEVWSDINQDNSPIFNLIRISNLILKKIDYNINFNNSLKIMDYINDIYWSVSINR